MSDDVGMTPESDSGDDPGPAVPSDALSYHDLYITTATLKRTRLSDLPHGYEVTCNRVGGWSAWKRRAFNPPGYVAVGGDGWELVGGEYERKGLRLDVAGHVIMDSLSNGPTS